MVSATTIIIGIIFVLIVLILVVYLVFYNRVILPTAVVTNAGFNLSNGNFFITMETLIEGATGATGSAPNIGNIIDNALTLQTIPSGEFIVGPQQWAFETTDGIIVATIGSGAQDVKSGTEVFMFNTYNGAYVTYDIEDNGDTQSIVPGSLVANQFSTSNANSFILEYTNPKIISLKSSLTPIKGAFQYMIPGGTITFLDGGSTDNIVSIGVPTNDLTKSWTIS